MAQLNRSAGDIPEREKSRYKERPFGQGSTAGAGRSRPDAYDNTIYKFYIRKYGIVYKYIFSDDSAEPRVEWKSDGVERLGKLYEY